MDDWIVTDCFCVRCGRRGVLVRPTEYDEDAQIEPYVCAACIALDQIGVN